MSKKYSNKKESKSCKNKSKESSSSRERFEESFCFDENQLLEELNFVTEIPEDLATSATSPPCLLTPPECKKHSSNRPSSSKSTSNDSYVQRWGK